MRARFIPKWSKNEDRSPRATALLIAQGSPDLDASLCSLNTSTPTATRLARQNLLSVAALKGWILWVADIATTPLQSPPQKRAIHVTLPRDALELLGGEPGTLTKLVNPKHGRADPVHARYLEARIKMESLGLAAHPLDPCLFLSFRDPTGSDQPPMLDGMICLHADDMLGAGDKKVRAGCCFSQIIKELQKLFEFCPWEQLGAGNQNLEYRDADFYMTDDDALHVGYAKYTGKIKPITMNSKRTDMDTAASTSEIRQRGLLGLLQWPAAQGCPHLACSVSMLQDQFGTATRRTLIEANQALRFLNTNDIGLTYRRFSDDYSHYLTEVGFVATTDSAWATRNDGTSQGGYLIMLVPKECFNDKPTPFMLLDWHSSKLRRACHSPLNSDMQSAATAVDTLEQAKVFWALMLDPDLDPREDSTMQNAGPSCLLTTTQMFCGAAPKKHVINFEDTRTGFEVKAIRERITASGSSWLWCHSERQYADGLAKTSARQLLAYRLRTMSIYLYDKVFVAAKKRMLNEHRESVRHIATTSASSSSTTALSLMVVSAFSVAEAYDMNKIPVNLALTENVFEMLTLSTASLWSLATLRSTSLSR